MPDTEEKKVNANKETEKTNNKGTNFGYNGVVSISVKDNKNKSIYHKKFHNNGSCNLFKFICECLSNRGNREEVPSQICLFRRQDGSSVNNVRSYFNSGGESSPGQALIVLATNLISVYGYEPAERISSHGTETKYLEGYKVVLHFRIPYSYITSNQISGLILLPKSTTSTIELVTCWDAYYLLTEIVGEDEEWDDMVISHASNYNLIIDWELSIANANDSTIES